MSQTTKKYTIKGHYGLTEIAPILADNLLDAVRAYFDVQHIAPSFSVSVQRALGSDQYTFYISGAMGYRTRLRANDLGTPGAAVLVSCFAVVFLTPEAFAEEVAAIKPYIREVTKQTV
jgi:hypothetical protein